ncbi:hypothetical protein [Micromonospora sp. NBC_01638]|uniref:hypothetical protein n=1 Tax=Micromonospora sp. NBC_01638 TaxID=2975982 RepID=UPI00386F8986|nr:hypothetical protein OG811_13930 [Micromonospora sp. NBC_01638]
MTVTPEPTTVPAAGLGARDRLNAGANGTIYRLHDYRLTTVPGPLVFKEYKLRSMSVSLAGLQNLVAVRHRMESQRRAAFDELSVWPVRVVVNDDGTPAGVLMRLIPDDFMQDIALPSGARERIPREVQHLIFDPATARQREIDVPADGDVRSRIAVCAQLAYAVSLLHGADLVYGDLSARNVLYRLRPTPSVLLVDCDAARVRGTAAVNKQQDTPDWDPPERATGSTPQSQATDRYKLALFILRCLAPGRGRSVRRDWALAAPVLGPSGTALLRAALEGPPGDRPKARQWLFHLRERLGSPSLPPYPAAVPAPARRVVTTDGWRRGADGTWVPAG